MLGNNIRNIRKEQKISINKLSKLTGVSLGYLSDLENDKAQNPSLDKLKLIANALNVPVDELLSTTATDKDIEEWDKDLKICENSSTYEKFSTPEAAMKFILEQPAIMGYGGFKIDELSDQDKIDFANDLLQQLKLISFKYKK